MQGLESEETSQEAADEVLLKVLRAGKTETIEIIERINECRVGLDGQRNTLKRRSIQIAFMLERALDRIGC